MSKNRRFVSYFGTAAEGCLRAKHLAKAMDRTWYGFNYLISKGKFPPPDFSCRCMRGWHPRTVRAHDADLARRAAQIAALEDAS